MAAIGRFLPFFGNPAAWRKGACAGLADARRLAGFDFLLGVGCVKMSHFFGGWGARGIRRGPASQGVGFRGIRQGCASLGGGFRDVRQGCASLGGEFLGIRQGSASLGGGFRCVRQGSASLGGRFRGVRQGFAFLDGVVLKAFCGFFLRQFPSPRTAHPA